MKLYGSSTLLWGKSWEEICKEFAGLGLSGIELWAEQFWHHHFSEHDVVRLADQYGLELTLHAASWDLNLCSLNKGIRQQSIAEVHRSIELASAIQAVNMTVHPGRLTLSGDWADWHLQCLHETVDLIEELGIQNDVIISLELMENVKKEFITMPEIMNELTKNRSEKIQTTFDVAHTPIHIDPLLYLKKLKRINKIHLSDSRDNVFHIPLGEGGITLFPILKELTSFHYPIVLEGYDPFGQKLLLKKHLKYLSACLLGEEKGRVI
ncbi:sugar phosphate isomerase/epimerase family protein [Niallia sp. 03133]|uniref:sugar phosphate isomerase/epimerase family protein n=1 Tax=Niallia sp. 03133 TaxID=3458060 RepID=UPI004043956F